MNVPRLVLICVFALLAAASALAADYTIKGDSTDITVYVTLYGGGNPSGSEEPTPVTGVLYSDTNLKAYYVRPGIAPQQITLATQSITGTHTDGGWIELSSTNAPGRYRLDIPDGVVESGVAHASVMVTYSNVGSGNYTVVDDIPIDLVGYDPRDGVRLGLSQVPAYVVGGRTGSTLFDGLVSEWKLDEVGAGDSALDSQGTNTLASVNAVTSATGLVYPLARNFVRASNQRLTLPDNASLSVGPGVSFTVRAWCRLVSESSTMVVLSKDASGLPGGPGATPRQPVASSLATRWPVGALGALGGPAARSTYYSGRAFWHVMGRIALAGRSAD